MLYRKFLAVIGLILSVSVLSAQDFTVDDSDSKEEESFNIEVTAQKRSEKIQEVPASITALNADDIESTGIDETQDIAEYVPGLNTYEFSDSMSYYSLRGQTNFNTYTTPVGVYIDDVPIANNGNSSDVRLWNVEQIEVLRGPAGNLYGLNSSAGVINIKTRQPDNYWTGGLKTGYGSYNSFLLDGNLSGPIVKDKLFFGLSGNFRRADSYINEKDADDQSSYFGGGRAQLRFTPFDRLDLSVSSEYGHYDADYNSWVIVDDDPYDVPSHWEDESYASTTSREAFRVQYGLEGFDLTSVTAYSYAEQGGVMDFSDAWYESGSTYYTDWNTESTRLTQELRLTSNNEKSSLQWIVGGFYQNGEDQYDANGKYYNDMLASYGITDEIDMTKNEATLNQEVYSLFGQIGYTFFDRVTVTPGARYDHDKKELDKTETSFNWTTFSDDSLNVKDSAEWNALSPRLAVDLKLSDEAMIYTSAARSYKAGGYSLASSGSDVENAKFDPEDAKTIELGAKTTWFKEKLLFNLAAYYSLIDDLQVFEMNDTGTAHIYSNVGQARVFGIESEIAVRPTHSLEVGIPVSWIYSEILEHDTADYEGNQAPLVPQYTAGLFAEYTHRLGLYLRGEGNFIGKTYFDEANDTSQDAYVVVNAKAGYKQEHYTITAYVKNILNEEYYNYKIDYGSNVMGKIGSPRTLGMEASMSF